MKFISLPAFLLFCFFCQSQTVNTHGFNKKSGVQVVTGKDRSLAVRWPAGTGEQGRLVMDLDPGKPLFRQVELIQEGKTTLIAAALDPVFWLTVGKRDLVSQNGWNIFFDRVPLKPFESHQVVLQKKEASVRTEGSRTIIRIGEAAAPGFTGAIEITLYKGSALFNVAAVVTTQKDSTAIVYDAGLVGQANPWKSVSYASVNNQLQTVQSSTDSAKNQDVKYRTIIGNNDGGSLALFPAPHQYFYPLDEAFNLKFTWYGNNYKNAFAGYGIGIRQDLYGDKRFVPWFNAPPGTAQRLNFFCQLSGSGAADALDQVKKLTRGDRYAALSGYKTMSSHFHNELVVKNVMANKPLPDTPNFVKVFKATGIDMVHLAEFHYTAHPQGPDELRLLELKYLFDMCRQYSDKDLLMMPGEEPNEFYGGHWLQLFPKPVYWIMSRKGDQPKVSQHPVYGTVYRVGSSAEMLQLLEKENGLAWTAHARTKGSTGYPDKYKTAPFFTSDRFLGAAWKAMPADLSQDKLGNGRILDLLDDMNNWGLHKKVIGEADLFTIEPENEMYAHLNVNYLQLDKVPAFDEGWQPVLDAMQSGRFFTTTGEVLIPAFAVDGQGVGTAAKLKNRAKAAVTFEVQYTFPLQYAAIISGDGEKTYQQKIVLNNTGFFGQEKIRQAIDLTGKKWVRLEVWDAAANGAFTQTIWLD